MRADNPDERLNRLEFLLTQLVYKLLGDDFFFKRQPEDYPSGVSKREVETLSIMVSNLPSQVGSAQKLSDITIEVNNLQAEVGNLQTELHEYFTLLSSDTDVRSVKLHRFLPIQIHLNESDYLPARAVSEAVQRLLVAMNFSISDDFKPTFGSWLKKIFAKSKQRLTQPEVTAQLLEIADKIRLAAEKNKIEEPQAAIDEKKSKAVRDLIEAMKEASDGVVTVGSLIVVKKTVRGKVSVVATSLTTKQMLHLDHHPQLLAVPARILQALAECESDEMLSTYPSVRVPPLTLRELGVVGAGEETLNQIRLEDQNTKLLPPP